MEEFNISILIGFLLGLLIGIFAEVIIFSNEKEELKISGSYLTYENVLYKKVSEEELENIIVLEMK